jgi:hypothetical protein
VRHTAAGWITNAHTYIHTSGFRVKEKLSKHLLGLKKSERRNYLGTYYATFTRAKTNEKQSLLFAPIKK